MIAGDFTIQLYSTKKEKDEWKRVYTLLTTFINGHSNPGGTYDENFSIKSNSQYSLTFSISKIVEGRINPLFHMIVENRRLRLTTIDYIVDFIITAITPQVTQNNVIYNVTCQDVFSYDWSKQNIKISYNSLEEHNKALYIDRHAKNILAKSKQEGRYMIDPALETKEFADFPNMLTTTMVQWTERTSSTLELTDTTPFSAMVELANKYGAALDITYPYANENKDNDKTIIGFKNQQTIPFKGLYIRPEVNLNNFSISRKTDNFCSILHVDGGEDADGNIVGLMPDMPHEVEKFIVRMEDIEDTEDESWKSLITKDLAQKFYDYCNTGANKNSISDPVKVSNYFSALERIVKSGGNFLYNFDYYYNNGLMSKKILKELEDIFSIELRNANLLTAAYTKQYNRLYSELMLLETEVEDYIASIAAENEYQDNLLKEKSANGVENELVGQDLINYNNSKAEVNNIMFDCSTDAKISLLDKIWIKNGDANSTYVNNGETIYGTYFINNKIVDLIKKKEEIEQEYFNYLYEAHKLESKYSKNSNGTVDWLDTITNSDGETEIVYSAENSNPDYIEYCYFTSQAKSIYTHVGPFTSSEGGFDLVVNKKGYYQVFIEELTKLLNYYHPLEGFNKNNPLNSSNKLNNYNSFEKEIREGQQYLKLDSNGDPIRIMGNDDSSVLITNLLAKAKKSQDEIWTKLYNEYGDFICEASYSDTTQISGDSLYLVAQKEFASRCNPSVDYSATIIDLHKVLNVNNFKIEVGDIIYFYNKDLYNQYNGNLILEIPDLKVINNIKISETFSPNKPVGKTSDSEDNKYAGDYAITADLASGATYTVSADIKSSVGDRTPNPRISIQGWYAIKGEDEATENDFISSQTNTPNKEDGIYYHYSASITTDPNKPLKKIQGWILDRSDVTEGYSPNREYKNAKITLTQNYDISSITRDNGTLSVYVKVKDLLKADELLNSPLEVWADGLPVTVINKYLDMKPKPIQLQITGITKKLRDATTQLTVSNNRMVENLLGKILRRTK